MKLALITLVKYKCPPLRGDGPNGEITALLLERSSLLKPLEGKQFAAPTVMTDIRLQAQSNLPLDNSTQGYYRC